MIVIRNDREVIIIGAGGHAKVTISTLKAAGWTVKAAYDDDPHLRGCRLYGVPVVGTLADAASLAPGQPAIIGVGGPQVRRRLADRFDFEWVSVAHPHAWVDPTVVLEEGVVVMAGAVVQPDTVLGRHSVVNTSASVDHEGRIGAFANVSPGAHLSGNVTVGEAAMIGVGASVLPGITIGNGTHVGGGAVVIRDLPANVVAVGCPTRVIRQLDRHAA